MWHLDIVCFGSWTQQRHTKWRQQKSGKLFIVIVSIVKFKKHAISKLHQRLWVLRKCVGYIMLNDETEN